MEGYRGDSLINVRNDLGNVCMIENDCECLFENDLFGNDWFYDCD